MRDCSNFAVQCCIFVSLVNCIVLYFAVCLVFSLRPTCVEGDCELGVLLGHILSLSALVCRRQAMSVRRASLLLSLQTLASATTSSSSVTSTSSPIRPARRPRSAYMPLTFPSPSPSSSPPSVSSACRSLSRTVRRRYVHQTAFASLAAPPPLRVLPSSLCMVCHSTPSSDDAVSIPPHVANLLAMLSSRPSSAAMAIGPPDPSAAAALNPRTSPQPDTLPSSLHASTSATPLSSPFRSTTISCASSSSLHSGDSPSVQSSTPLDNTTAPHESARDITDSRSPAGGMPPDTSSEHEPESDTALSTSTVTSVDSTDVHASDSREHSGPNVQFTFFTGVAFVPHPDKRDKGGEDAFFIQDHAMGVFDGVGGWSSVGIDAGLYSKELARLTALHIERDGPATAVEALKTATMRNSAIGSSTACVVGLDAEHLIGVNLGDSGLVIIRRGDIVYRTNEQQHYFNCPFQVGTDSIDTVEVGAPIKFTLQQGDCIIMGTDGLWDNVFPKEVLQIVLSHGVGTARSTTTSTDSSSSPRAESAEDSKSSASKEETDATSMVSDCANEERSGKNVQVIAEQLAEAACRVANDERGTSPFSVNARNAGHLFLGGKVDDITILVALVLDSRTGFDGGTKKSPASVMDSSMGFSSGDSRGDG